MFKVPCFAGHVYGSGKTICQFYFVGYPCPASRWLPRPSILVPRDCHFIFRADLFFGLSSEHLPLRSCLDLRKRRQDDVRALFAKVNVQLSPSNLIIIRSIPVFFVTPEGLVPGHGDFSVPRRCNLGGPFSPYHVASCADLPRLGLIVESIQINPYSSGSSFSIKFPASQFDFRRRTSEPPPIVSIHSFR